MILYNTLRSLIVTECTNTTKTPQ